ncbi:MAG: hypothetical protein P4L22_00670 [Candidatus Babeliales bacterium]|nr:hypothetical protein [Candidatus Babeliales bacterium]
MKNRLFILLFLLSSIGQIRPSEMVVAKLKEYKTEIGVAAGLTVGGIGLYQAYRNYCLNKDLDFLRANLATSNQQQHNERQRFLRLISSRDTQFQSLLRENAQLILKNKQLILDKFKCLANCYISLSNLKRKNILFFNHITNLYQEFRQLRQRNESLISQVNHLAHENNHRDQSYSEQIERLTEENFNLNARIQSAGNYMRAISSHVEAENKEAEEQEDLQNALRQMHVPSDDQEEQDQEEAPELDQQRSPSSGFGSAAVAPAASPSNGDMGVSTSAPGIKHEQASLQSASSSDCGDSYHEVEMDIEHSIREIQEFIDHVITLKKNSGNNLEWHHYLLYNYKTIKCKIAKIKRELDNKQDDSSRITLETKVIPFDLAITELEASSPWGIGKRVMGKLIQYKSAYIEKIKIDPKKHLQAIVYLVWYFYSLAAKKGQDFDQGSFGISYEKDLLFCLLDSYEKNYNRTGFLSSHYSEYKNMQQYGIDIPRELRNIIILPGGMTHILFGLVPDEGNLFLKPEDHGILDPMDWIEHAQSFISAQLRKYVGKGDEQAGMNKERVPQEVITAWDKFFEDCNFSQKPEKLPAFIKLGKKYGIASMLKIIERSGLFTWNSESTNRKIAKAKFMSVINKFDNIDIRKGNEVILTQENFKQ